MMPESELVRTSNGLDLDPRAITSHYEFAAALRLLRARSGSKSLRALDQLLQKRFGSDTPRFTTLGDWFSGKHLPTPALAQGFVALLNILGIDSAAESRQWTDALDRIRTLPGPRPANTSAPYRGLAPYELEHADLFSGRDGLTAELVSKAEASAAAGRITFVVGPSGSGKSSLLRAGLIPAHRARQDHQPANVSYILMTPGVDPVNELANHVGQWLDEAPEELALGLLADPSSCRRLLEVAPPDRPLLIVVDQFEEIFTLADHQTSTAFIAALSHAANGSTQVVVGMRSDFYTRALHWPQLVSSLQTAQLAVGPMSEDELRQAIENPALKANIKLQPGLVEVLLRDLTPLRAQTPKDTAHEPGALPLLSHALLSTWEQARGKTLTIDHYHQAGAIKGAVARTAEAAYLDLELNQRETARRIFMRLVHSGEDAADTRRVATLHELLDVASAEDLDVMQAVLDRFIVSRLLTVDSQRVEIVHEALISAWPRLVEWLESDRQWRQVHRRLQSTSRQWIGANRPDDMLYRGSVLGSAREWIEDRGYHVDLSQLERNFIEASLGLHDLERLREERRRKGRRRLLAGVATLMLLATGGIGYALQLRMASEREQTVAAIARAEALSRQVADKSERLRKRDPALAMQLALAAYQISPTPEARSSLLNSTAVPTATRLVPASGQARSIAAGRDQAHLAVGTNEGKVEIWGVNDSPPKRLAIASSHTDTSLVALAFSRDGRHLAAGGKDKTLYLWRMSDINADPIVLPNLAGEVIAVAISPDNRTLAAANGTNVSLWNISGPTRTAPMILTGPTETVRALAFTPDSRILAAGSNDSSVHLWNVSDPEKPTKLSVLNEPTSRVFSLAISADGHMLAAGTGAEHSVYVWDITDPARPRMSSKPLTGPASWINAVSFDPEGRTLAAGSSDADLWVFDVATGVSIAQLPHPNPVTGSTHLNDRMLATVSTDGIARLWRTPPQTISGFSDSVFTIAFDPSGTKLSVATGAGDNTMTVWDVSDQRRPTYQGQTLVPSPGAPALSGSGTVTPDGRAILAGDLKGNLLVWDFTEPRRTMPIGILNGAATQLIEAVTVSSDSQTAALSSDDGTVALVDISDPARPKLLASIRAPEPGFIYGAAFHPSGDQIAVASANQNVYLWDIRNPSKSALQTTLKGFTAAAYSVAYSHDGHLLAAGSADNTVRIWDVSRPTSPQQVAQPLTGPVGYVGSVAFRPGARLLATGSTDSTVWLWDLTDPHRPKHLATLTGATNAVLTVAFNPRGDQLAASGHDRIVRQWNTSPDVAMRWICSVAGTYITAREWELYIPDQPYRAPCP